MKVKFDQLLVFLGFSLSCLLFFASYAGFWDRFSPGGKWQTNKSDNFDNREKIAYFNGQILSLPKEYTIKTESNVLGKNDSAKRIEIDLTAQRLWAFENNKVIYSFLISSGKWGRTPTGHFRIWIKLKYTKMEGGSKLLNTYYYLPNVPYAMFFYNEAVPKWKGFGIHGTYWHSNFGHPMSHGCINMKTEEAALLYYWTRPELGDRQSVLASEENPGTPVVIYGEAPNE